MPAVDFTIRCPDGARQRCSSPSGVIHEHLSLGMRLPVSEFGQPVHVVALDGVQLSEMRG
jgi:uncharacterized repeat protein (TIGR04042 family)